MEKMLSNDQRKLYRVDSPVFSWSFRRCWPGKLHTYPAIWLMCMMAFLLRLRGPKMKRRMKPVTETGLPPWVWKCGIQYTSEMMINAGVGGGLVSNKPIRLSMYMINFVRTIHLISNLLPMAHYCFWPSLRFTSKMGPYRFILIPRCCWYAVLVMWCYVVHSTVENIVSTPCTYLYLWLFIYL